MMSSKCLALLVVLLLAGCYADVEVSWDWPTTRENGEFLEMSEIAGARLRYQRTGDEPTLLILPGLDNAYTVEKLPPGTWSFAVATEDTDGLMSSYSNSNGVIINLAGGKTYIEGE